MPEVKVWERKHLMRQTGNRGHDRGYSYLRNPAMHRVIVAQLVATFLLALLLLPVSVNTAVSAFVGGLCCGIPNAFLIWKAFQYRGASAAKAIVSSFYLGEIGKFVLTILAFVLVFTLIKPVEPWALFGAFFVVQSINWLTPLLVKQRQSKNSN